MNICSPYSAVPLCTVIDCTQLFGSEHLFTVFSSPVVYICCLYSVVQLCTVVDCIELSSSVQLLTVFSCPVV